MSSIDADATRFWGSLCPHGEELCSWDAFVRAYSEVEGDHHGVPAQRVLRYAMWGDAAPSKLALRQFETYLKRYGPFPVALTKATGSLFEPTGQLVPWFHADADRSHCEQMLSSEGRPGSFLLRHSSTRADCFHILRIPTGCSASTISNHLIVNLGAAGYTYDEAPRTPHDQRESWPTLRHFVQHYRHEHLLHEAVVSHLADACARELELSAGAAAAAPPAPGNGYHPSPPSAPKYDGDILPRAPPALKPSASGSSSGGGAAAAKKVSLSELPAHPPMWRGKRTEPVSERLLDQAKDAAALALNAKLPAAVSEEHRARALELLERVIEAALLPGRAEEDRVKPLTMCKALGHEGALLLAHEPEAALRSYRRALALAARHARRLRDDGLPCGECDNLRWRLHGEVASYCLLGEGGGAERCRRRAHALDHYAHMLGLMAERRPRQELARRWRGDAGFTAALAEEQVDVDSLKCMLEQGCRLVREGVHLDQAANFNCSGHGGGSAPPAAARLKFEAACSEFACTVRAARCLLGAACADEVEVLEARALGNWASTNMKLASMAGGGGGGRGGRATAST
ncbi:hypothetical protein JKP88DRAFT_268705 [Tribonema minus]|uniref:SH2 domain-containing protein n=1 Tax=Tribonema minus TaxID=303371 RepID=A0A835YXL5_9STRA|nr:hypothetical protein JKP88DRAFT_268705 [Tribonema minus]